MLADALGLARADRDVTVAATGATGPALGAAEAKICALVVHVRFVLYPAARSTPVLILPSGSRSR